LVPIIKKYMRRKNSDKGCIVMLQIENEYGFYGTDKTYMEALRKLWKDLGISLTEYYVDWI
jgi:beta-galactosidase